jgi:hypothetical protein
MFSPSLFTKQQMELLFDHSTKSLAEILREAAASANRQRQPACKLGALSGPEIPIGSGSDRMKERCGIGTVGLSNYIACTNTTLSVESPDNAKKRSILPLEAVSILARSFCAVLMEA